MPQARISERKVILYTMGMVVCAGLLGWAHSAVGTVLFYTCFALFLTYRLFSIFGGQRPDSPPPDRRRTAISFAMLLTLVLNILGWQQANFFLIFLLMVDYLVVINRPRSAGA